MLGGVHSFFFMVCSWEPVLMDTTFIFREICVDEIGLIQVSFFGERLLRLHEIDLLCTSLSQTDTASQKIVVCEGFDEFINSRKP